ncbi:hypothetical protein [Paucibacter soli]|uniref:hypothetical protein n=1 Tax=Paucibacter soli TaxID=3133433 RepID=UPI0030A0AD71
MSKARTRSFNPVVLTGKTIFLQRIQAAVTDGYRFYILGTVAPQKAPGLVMKFKELYGVHLDKHARYRRKLAGHGNARLYLRLNENLEIDFALLVAPGLHLAHETERLADAGVKGMRYRELELVRVTLQGRSQPGLTWRLSADTVAMWRERLHLHTARYNVQELFRDWHSLYRVPGFGGVRRQVGDLVAYWRREWAQLRGQDPCPIAYPHNEPNFRRLPGVSKRDDGRYWTSRGFPSASQLPTLFYVRKQSDVGEDLTKTVKALMAAVRAPVGEEDCAASPDAGVSSKR